MSFSFDLISDLHIETWPTFDWTYQATSPYCILAGDVSRDRQVLLETLLHLSSFYQAVFYIDGNDEHREYLADLETSYNELAEVTGAIDNVVFMRHQVVIINGVAILAANAWWTFDFDPLLDSMQSRDWYANRYQLRVEDSDQVYNEAINDASYLVNSVKKLQTHQDVKSIVMLTHTVPDVNLVTHDLELINTWRFNSLGNSYVRRVFEQDTERKIKLWCFGHYHQPVDRIVNQVRFVNNCRGRNGTDWSQSVYYPKKITVEI